MTPAGKRNEKVSLYRVGLALKDGAGYQIKGLVPYRENIWAAISQISGREQVLAKSFSVTTTHTVRLNYDASIAADMVIIWGARSLHVDGVIDADGLRRETTCFCTESVGAENPPIIDSDSLPSGNFLQFNSYGNIVPSSQSPSTILQGYSGYSGYSGPSGPSGATGSSGATGATGAAGASGYSGYSGPSGPAGATGSNGATGTSGYSGYSGESVPSGVYLPLTGGTVTGTINANEFHLLDVDTSDYLSGITMDGGVLRIIANDSVSVNSTLFADAFSGDGASITALNASNLSSGTVPTARLGSGTANSSTLLRGDSTWATIPTGTVTSVSLSLPSIITVSGSPVTSSGTLTGTLANQNANLIFSGPSTGSPAAPTFRSLATADIPNLDAAKITTGALATARLGTGTASAGAVLTAGVWRTSLLDSNAFASVAYQNRTLNTISFTVLDWQNLQLLDTNSNLLSVDWGLRQLRDSSGALSVDWDNREITDGAETNSIDWNNRLLFDTGGNPIASWSTAFNVARTDDPSSPNAGDIWFNTIDGVLRFYDGSEVQTVATV